MFLQYLQSSLLPYTQCLASQEILLSLLALPNQQIYMQISFHVCLVAVAVIAITLTDVSNNPLISPRFEYSFLNSLPLH